MPMAGSSLLGGGRAKHKRQSVSFGDAEQVRNIGLGTEKGAEKSELDEERRRKERRRGEARAAIEVRSLLSFLADV